MKLNFAMILIYLSAAFYLLSIRPIAVPIAAGLSLLYVILNYVYIVKHRQPKLRFFEIAAIALIFFVAII